MIVLSCPDYRRYISCFCIKQTAVIGCSLPLFQLLEGSDKQAQTETRRPSGASRWLISFFLVVFGETVEKKMSNLVWTRWNKQSALIYFPLSFQTDVPCLLPAFISPRRWGAHRGTSITAFLQTLCFRTLMMNLRAAAAVNVPCWASRRSRELRRRRFPHWERTTRSKGDERLHLSSDAAES